MPTRKITHIAVLAALVVALGYALSGIPNVELMTLAAFAAGASVGRVGGAIVGGVAMSIYSGFNPYGVAPPPVFAAQVAGLAGIGVAGGWMAAAVFRPRRPRTGAALVVGGVLGGGLALLYDILTNLGTAWAMGAMRDPWPVVAGGIAFGVGHLAWNALVFAIVLPPLLAALRRREAATL